VPDTANWTPKPNPNEDYERLFVPVLFRPFGEELVALAAPMPGEQVLDVACGTGILARLVAPRLGQTGKITGLDLSPEMLAVARTAVDDANVEWREASAVAMPFPNESFDLVLCQQGLQFFPDRASGMREMRRVLRPGGRLVLACWRSTEFNPVWFCLEEALAAVAGPEAGGLPPFRLGSRDELRALAVGAGLTSVSVRIETKLVRFASPEEFVRRSALSAPSMLGALSSVGAGARDELVREANARMQPYVDDLGLAAPIRTHILFARV